MSERDHRALESLPVCGRIDDNKVFTLTGTALDCRYIPEFRVGTLNMLIDTVNEGVSFRISTQPVSNGLAWRTLWLQLIPDGYRR